jgi:alkylhydroperoxidase/carboxymuconolactone decarboxylase family protein YurZ
MTELELLRLCHLDVAEEYEALFALNRAKVLDAEEQELILLGVHAALGSEKKVGEHGERALAAGASPGAIVETVLAAAISRGPGALSAALPFLSQLQLTGEKTHESDNSVPPIQYFESEFESLPDWVRYLNTFSPDSLANYASLRSRVLKDGAADRKTKELLTMLLNAVAGNGNGIAAHARAAMRCGASREEMWDVLLLGVRIGGIVVWINGVNALQYLGGEDQGND